MSKQFPDFYKIGNVYHDKKDGRDKVFTGYAACNGCGRSNCPGNVMFDGVKRVGCGWLNDQPSKYISLVESKRETMEERIERIERQIKEGNYEI